MSWRKIGYQKAPGAHFEMLDGDLETWRKKYDSGHGEMAKLRNRVYGGFDLLWEDNKPPFKMRKPEYRFYRRSRRF